MTIQRAKGNGPYAPLGAGYYRDDALLEAGEAAELLFVRALSYCAESTSDGFISDRQLTMVVGIGMKDAVRRADRLIEVGLWERVEGGYVVRSWLKWNRSADDIGRYRKKDRERKASKPGEGKESESDRIPGGVGSDSLLYSTTQHNTAIHSTSASRPAAQAVASPDDVEPVNVRANRLAKVYSDLVPMSRFPAVAGIVKQAIRAGKSDAEITAALTRLGGSGRSLTVETLRVELEGMPPAPQRQGSTTDGRVQVGADLVARLRAQERGELTDGSHTS